MSGDTRDENVFADEGEWWRSWWARDYSWDQLATKPLEGFSVDKAGHHFSLGVVAAAGDASQQDFWNGADLIPELDRHGQVVRHWTPAHLPSTFETGEPAKSQWTEVEWLAMEENLEARIRKFAENGVRVQLEGLVLRRLPGADATEIFYAWTAFIRRIEAALECRSAFFYRAFFAGGARFDGSTFELSASFQGALFNADAYFRDVEFASYGQFSHACFKADVEFQRSTVNRLILKGVRCDAMLAMASAKISANVILAEARLHSLIANWVQAGEFNLAATQIASFAHIRNARIRAFLAKSLEVSGVLDMENTEVAMIGMFDTFIGETATFANFKCSGDAVFSAMRCMGQVEFSGAEFGTRSAFRSAVFEKAVAFEGVKWPEGERVAGAFRDTIFHRLADFRGETPPSPAAFDGCIFRSEARFDRLAFAEDRLFRASQRGAKDDAALESLENGCRALKLAAEGTRDRLSEQRFHRYELICRRRSKSTPRSERLFSSIYGLAGDYGGSLTRPLSNLAGLWLVMALVFALWGGAHMPAGISLPDLFIQAIETAGRNIFNPLGIWLRPAAAPKCVPDEIESVLAWCSGPGPRLVFRLISTLQALAAGVLFFLAALAIKRRFQIA